MRLGNVKDATPEELRQLQLRELQLLEEVRPILDKYGLRFFINGGTLIGAVRHQGFVPWDDDMDLIMPRKDYERFYSHPEWLEGTKFKLERSNEQVNQHLTGMELKDVTTTFINKHSVSENITHSLAIDITPLDYRPVGKLRRKLQIIYAAIFSLFNADRVPDHQGKVLRYIAKLPLSLVRSRKAKYRIWSWAQRRMVSLGNERSGEVVELGVGYKALFRIDDAQWFASSVELPFEDTTLPAPVGYDTYLRAVVGNYMEFPPESTRVAKHNTYLVDTKVPYSEELRKPYLKK